MTEAETLKILEIIDTVVKIGIGALISGVATYIITVKKHTNELSKDKINRKVKIIEGSIDIISTNINNLEDLLSAIDGCSLKCRDHELEEFTDEQYDFIAKNDDTYCDNRASFANVFNKLKLAEIYMPQEYISKFIELDNEVRNKVIFNKEIPSQDEVNNWLSKLSSSEANFYNYLSEKYNKI